MLLSLVCISIVTYLSINAFLIVNLYVTVSACDAALKRRERERDVEPACRVPLVTSAREEQMLISTSSKPVVKLLINRHNNKYSYTRYKHYF